MRTVLMNFSGCYDQEGFRPENCLVLDFSFLEETCCYCGHGSACRIREMIGPFGPDGIHWLDSGDYHYLSFMWMEKLNRPFELLLIDNHTDDGTALFGDDILSCGGWVRTAGNTLPDLKHVHFTRTSDLPRELLSPGLPVYISIDKDVLSEKYASTDWDQASMTLDELESVLRRTASSRKIIGVDVCGGLSLAKGAQPQDLQLNRRTNEEIQKLLLHLQD